MYIYIFSISVYLCQYIYVCFDCLYIFWLSISVEIVYLSLDYLSLVWLSVSVMTVWFCYDCLNLLWLSVSVMTVCLCLTLSLFRVCLCLDFCLLLFIDSFSFSYAVILTSLYYCEYKTLIDAHLIPKIICIGRRAIIE